MNKIIRGLVVNTVLIIIFYVLSLFVESLSLSLFQLQPLWLVIGFNLTVTLIFGYQVLPSIALGNLLLLRGMDSSITHAPLISIAISCLMVVQSYATRQLLVRYQVFPRRLIEKQALVLFYVISMGVLIPVITLIIGILTINGSLLDQQIVPVGLYGISWSIISIIIFTPVLYCLSASSPIEWQHRFLRFVLPLLCAITLVTFIVINLSNQKLSQAQQSFQSQVEFEHSLLEKKLAEQYQLLRAMRAYFQNSEYVSEKEFSVYINHFSNYYDKVLAAVWLEHLKPNLVGRAVDQQGYTVTQNDLYSQRFHAAKKQKQTYSVKYFGVKPGLSELSTFLKNIKGQDICKGQAQKLLCGNLVTGNEISGVTSFFSVREPLTFYFLYLMPIFEDTSLKGFVGHIIDYDVLFKRSLDDDSPRLLAVNVFDEETQQVIFSSDQLRDHDMALGDDFSAWKTASLGDQTWMVKYTPSSPFFKTLFPDFYVKIITSQIAVIAVIALWIMTAMGNARRTEKQVLLAEKSAVKQSKLLVSSQQQYQNLVEQIGEEFCTYILDSRGKLIYISPAITPLLGYAPSQFIESFSDFLPKTILNKSAKKSWLKSLSGKASHYEVELTDSDGQVKIFSLKEIPQFDNSGNLISIEGLAQDISWLRKSQFELEKMSAALEHSPSAIVITNKQGIVEYINPKFSELTGYTSSETVGGRLDIISSGLTPKSTYIDLWDQLLSGKEWHGELQNCKRNGEIYWARERIAPIFDKAGNITHFVATQEDITEVKRLNEQKNYQASHDLLTGLVNRGEFEVRLNRAIKSAKRDFSEHALCFLDLDQFKIINDTCGHVAGDELLRQIASLMQKNIRSRDTLARLGGDEFAILMENCAVDQAYSACQKMVDLIKEFRFHWEEHTFTIGVSIGLAVIDQHITDDNEAMRFVDSACYAAKDGGRNRVEVHTDDSERLLLRTGEIQWNNEINEALDEDRFLLYIQPIVPINDDITKVSYEVLSRLKMKDDSITLPGSFLPAAERYNSSRRIDMHVVTKLFDWLVNHLAVLDTINVFTVNLSGHSVGDRAVLDFVVSELKRTGIPGNKIKFEITETATISNLTEATHFIETLSTYGCNFVLDDFGSGLSSFGYLKNLQVTGIKIDGMFVKDILNDPFDLEMVKSINDIGHVMGLETIAEFVETQEVLDKLKTIGVDSVQGYLLGKPMPIDDILL